MIWLLLTFLGSVSYDGISTGFAYLDSLWTIYCIGDSGLAATATFTNWVVNKHYHMDEMTHSVNQMELNSVLLRSHEVMQPTEPVPVPGGFFATKSQRNISWEKALEETFDFLDWNGMHLLLFNDLSTYYYFLLLCVVYSIISREFSHRAVRSRLPCLVFRTQVKFRVEVTC